MSADYAPLAGTQWGLACTCPQRISKAGSISPTIVVVRKIVSTDFVQNEFLARFDAGDISKLERNSSTPYARGRNFLFGRKRPLRRQARNAPKALPSGERHAKSAYAPRRTSQLSIDDPYVKVYVSGICATRVE